MWRIVTQLGLSLELFGGSRLGRSTALGPHPRYGVVCRQPHIVITAVQNSRHFITPVRVAERLIPRYLE